MRKLSIIIVNWNSGKRLTSCINSIFESEGKNEDVQVIVVDNKSTDHSVDSLHIKFPDVKIIYNPENIGFGGANNIGLSEVSSQYVLFLNPDVVMFPDTLSKCLCFMDQNANIDVLGVKNLDLNGTVAKSCTRFPSTITYIYDMLGLSKLFPKYFRPATIMFDWDHLESRFVDQVIGAFMMIRFTILEKTGFFDERFFVYMEDLDLSKRIKESGGSIYYNSEISIFHEGGGTSKAVLTKRLFYLLQSRTKYIRKYRKEFNLTIIIAFSLLIEPITRTLFLATNKRIKEIPNVFAAYYLYYKWLILNK